jgi:hypothetical protein
VGGPQLVEILRRGRIGGREQVKEQDAEAVDVAPRGGRFARQDFRRQVERRPRNREGIGPLHTARAEIHEHQAALVLTHHVLGLDVAVHQTRGVDGRQRAAQIHACRDRLTRAHHAV